MFCEEVENSEQFIYKGIRFQKAQRKELKRQQGENQWVERRIEVHQNKIEKMIDYRKILFGEYFWISVMNSLTGQNFGQNCDRKMFLSWDQESVVGEERQLEPLTISSAVASVGHLRKKLVNFCFDFSNYISSRPVSQFVHC